MAESGPVSVVGPLPITLAVGTRYMDANPCYSPACADLASEECRAYTAEYCMSHPEDSGCALLLMTRAQPPQSTLSGRDHWRR